LLGEGVSVWWGGLIDMNGRVVVRGWIEVSIAARTYLLHENTCRVESAARGASGGEEAIQFDSNLSRNILFFHDTYLQFSQWHITL